MTPRKQKQTSRPLQEVKIHREPLPAPEDPAELADIGLPPESPTVRPTHKYESLQKLRRSFTYSADFTENNYAL